MGLNGNNRCIERDCPFGAAAYLTRGYCEEHFDKNFIHPVMKQLSSLQGELTKLHKEKLQAKLDYNVKPEPIIYRCHNMDKGCPFKITKRDILEIHEKTNCKFKKAPSQPRKPGQPAPKKAPVSAQMMSDE